MRYIWFVLSLMLGCTESHAATDAIQRYNYDVDRDQIVEKFHNLTKSGGLIESPKLPEEFYYNASNYVQKGDLINARKAYESFFVFNIPFVDVVSSYIAILKTQEADYNIINILKKINDNRDNPAFEMFIALQEISSTKKLANLNSVLNKYNKFAPVYYYIANDPYIDEFKNVANESYIDSIDRQISTLKRKVKEYEHVVDLFDRGFGNKFYFDKLLARNVYDHSKIAIQSYNMNINAYLDAKKTFVDADIAQKKLEDTLKRQNWVSAMTQTAIQTGSPEQTKIAISEYEKLMKESGLNDTEISEIKEEALRSDTILQAKNERNKLLKESGMTDAQIDRVNNPDKPIKFFAGDNGIVAAASISDLAKAFNHVKNNEIDAAKDMKRKGLWVKIPKGEPIKLLSKEWEYKNRILPGVPLVKIEHNEMELWTTPDQLAAQ